MLIYNSLCWENENHGSFPGNVGAVHIQYWFLGPNLEFGSKSLKVLFTVSSKGIRDFHINAFSWVCHMHHRVPKMDNILFKASSDPRLFWLVVQKLLLLLLFSVQRQYFIYIWSIYTYKVYIYTYIYIHTHIHIYM